jgi:ABC-type Zn uptake system ZnuABC Zn-binding protein ZnuA
MSNMLLQTLLLAALAGPAPKPAPAPLKVVTSLTTYGAIAREIVGDKATVTSIAQGNEDPHSSTALATARSRKVGRAT